MGAVVGRQRRASGGDCMRSSGEEARTIWTMRDATLPRREAVRRALGGFLGGFLGGRPQEPPPLGLVARDSAIGARDGALVTHAREQGEHANEDTTRQDDEHDHERRHTALAAAMAVEQGAVLGAVAVEGAQGQANPTHIEERREPPERIPRGRGGGGELHGIVPQRGESISWVFEPGADGARQAGAQPDEKEY